jgi:hypothetical protein
MPNEDDAYVLRARGHISTVLALKILACSKFVIALPHLKIIKLFSWNDRPDDIPLERQLGNKAANDEEEQTSAMRLDSRDFLPRSLPDETVF